MKIGEILKIHFPPSPLSRFPLVMENVVGHSSSNNASFDVYLPVIDMEALENHLAAKIAEDQMVSGDAMAVGTWKMKEKLFC